MVANSKIEWTDHTFNAWIGCTKVSPACDHCYAESWSKRFGRAEWGPGKARERTSAANWRQPLAWDKAAAADGVKRFVFCNSLSDVFDNEVQPEWRRDLWDLIIDTPHLVWLVLTKRIGNVEKLLPYLPWPDNAWPGITVPNQLEADRDIQKLLAAKAALGIPRVFLSVEPMLGPINLDSAFYPECTHEGAAGYDPDTGVWECAKCDAGEYESVDWVICGGESGPDARPMHPDWARALRDQCAAAGVPFMFKQWGEWGPIELEPPGRAEPMGVICSDGELLRGKDMTRRADDPNAEIISRFGKKAAGRLLDGVEHNGRPNP